jgi:hypothetical protein
MIFVIGRSLVGRDSVEPNIGNIGGSTESRPPENHSIGATRNLQTI